MAIREKPFETFVATKSNDQVRFASAHFSGNDRYMSQEGRCWYIPMMFCELPFLWTNNNNDIDIAMFQVAPMDEYGNFNLGPQVADMWGVIRAAKKIIVEVNQNMPVAHVIRRSLTFARSTTWLRKQQPAGRIAAEGSSETDRKIAAHVVEKIRSNSTLQLGIGSLPLCIGQMIADSDLNNIKAHTEMLTDAYVDLFNAGKLTGDKPIDVDKAVYTSQAAASGCTILSTTTRSAATRR